MVLLSKWRSISAFLLRRIYGQNVFSQTDPRLRNILEARLSLDLVIHPYAKVSSGNDERLRKLEDLFKRAARFGYLLFSQPSCWEFDWKDAQDAAAERLIIFPALLQVADDEGKPLQKPRVLEKQEAIEITGGLM